MAKPTDEEKKALKAKIDSLDADEREAMAEALGVNSHTPADLLKTVEKLQLDVTDIKKKLDTTTPTRARRQSLMQKFFGE